MFAVIVLAAVLAILLMPYIKRAWERGSFIRSLRKVCALKKYKLEIANPFSAYFKNFSDTYDVTVDTGRVLYAVKFWNEYYKNSNLVFSKTRKVMRRNKSPEVFGKGEKMTHRISEKYLGRLPELAGVERENRKTVSFFLINMRHTSVWRFDGKEAVKLNVGDKIYDMTVISHKIFLDNIGR